MTPIHHKALSEARSLVKSMLWQMHPPDELKFIWAKGCAIVAVRKMMKEYEDGYGYGASYDSDLFADSERLKVLKALPKAINSLKFKK